jgi:hypothetical protein
MEGIDQNRKAKAREHSQFLARLTNLEKGGGNRKS